MNIVRRIMLIAASLVLLNSTAAVTAQPSVNPSDSCITDFDPEVDYFPEKAEVEYAENFTIEYFNAYKVVTVPLPWVGAAEGFQYVIVPCGAPTPEGFDDAQVIEMPVDRAAVMSTTLLPHFTRLGILDTLVALDNASYTFTSTPEILDLVAAGDVLDIGSGASVDIESVLDAEIDLVLTYGSGSPEFDAHPALLDAGVPVAITAEYLETTPLGQAEWIKFTAAFFNAEAAANAAFDPIVARYQELAALTADIPADERPVVLWNSFYPGSDFWAVPGDASYVQQLVEDAGGTLVLRDDPAVQGVTGSTPFDYEVVYGAGLDADIWIPNAFGWNTLADVVAADERYADFAAVQNAQVYNNDARVSPNGGSDYYESGVNSPDVILADLIRLFQPELLPDHQLVYYRQIAE